MVRRLLLALSLPLLLASCDGKEQSTPAKADAIASDAASGGVWADAAADAAADGGSDVAAVPFATGCTLTWQAETAAIDPKQRKFATALFHYNLEYVIGGLEATLPDGTKKRFGEVAANAGWNNEKVEDYIVDQTLKPILEMYDKHPSWGVDIELQAYAIEVMAKRHPQTLALLQKMVQRGQVSLISFHYAAQLFLAFSREDQLRSLDATKEVMAQHCMPLSTAVFNQEGQAGEGRQRLLIEQGWKIGVFPKNLWKYQHKGDDGKWWPLYSSEGGDLIVGPGGTDPSTGFDLAWSFFDDGELRAVEKTSVGPLNPYFAPKAPTSPARVAEYEADLLNLEKAGFKITRIADYVRHLKAAGVQAKPAPPLLDGTWQAPSTNSVHKWLGGMGIPFGLDEQDNAVRTGNARAHVEVSAVQVMVDALGKSGASKPEHPQNLLWVSSKVKVAELWRLLWHAQVSDCSGINPWWGEVTWGLNLNAQIGKEAKVVRDQLIAASGKPMARVDLATRTADYGQWSTAPVELKPVDAPFAVTLTGDRPLTANWFANGAPNSYLLFVDATPTDCEACTYWDNLVAFPRFEETIRYSPGLIEDEVREFPLSAFQFSMSETYLPLPNGLIGLGNGWWVIKVLKTVHLAAHLPAGQKQIDFNDQTASRQGFHWEFVVVKQSKEQALQQAQLININPTVTY